MSSNLERISVIEKEKLVGEFYFQSLLEQGFEKGLLTDSDIERLQYDSLNLLTQIVERYNSGDSSSIRVEKAQDIMTSNMFTIGLWLKTFQNPDDAITAIKNEQIAELYQKGRKRIDTMVAASKAVHSKMLTRFVGTKNVFYRATIVDAIKGFFKLYYPDFGAHEIHITADYPTHTLMQKLAGIEFIKAYLDALYQENQFCLYFDPDDVHHLLCGYEENYEELLINIYEPVLTAAVGCVLAGTDARKLDITEDGAARLCRLFKGMAKSEILAAIQNAVDALKRVFDFPPGLELYVQRSCPLIADRIEIAIREGLLNHVFYSPVYPEHLPKLYLSFGEKMDNELYRKVTEEIMQCRITRDRIAIIKQQIHSLADLEDVLLDVDLSREEILSDLHELSAPEIAALSKKYSVLSGMEAIEYSWQEQKLRKCLYDFIASLPCTQGEMLVKAIEAIEEASF